MPSRLLRFRCTSGFTIEIEVVKELRGCFGISCSVLMTQDLTDAMGVNTLVLVDHCPISSVS
jgi:hypothetical protein